MMRNGLDKLKETLGSRLTGIAPDRIVFVGVGNPLRGDDAIGPAVISLLEGKAPHAIDAGTAPENVTGMIKRLKPAVIVIVDAVHFGAEEPGTVRVVEIEETGGIGLSTHRFSLGTIMEYLKHDTGADVFMIGVQPEFIGDRQGISERAYSAIKKLAEAIFFFL